MILHAISEFTATLAVGATVTTVEIWTAVHATPYVRNVGASPNAAFGRLIAEHAKDLRLGALAEEPTIDSEGGPTTTMRWAKLPR